MDKCSTILNMQSPNNVKEVQQLTGRVTSLSPFLSKSGDKSFPFFQCLRKIESFIWSEECQETFY